MSKKKRLISCVVLSGLILFLVSGCGQKTSPVATSQPKQLQKVTLILDWTPNTNHTGLYVAKDKGYYAEQGLDVEIIQPGQGTTAEQLVAAGKADFGVSYQEAVTQARATGVPLVSVAAVIQHNTSAFASLKKDNITSVKDFEGKRYGGWGSPTEEAVIKAVMQKTGADFTKTKIITLGSTDFFASIGRDADYEWIYYGWDGVQAKLQGKELNLIMVKDLDPVLDYYTPVLITNAKHATEQQDLVKKFVAATAKGYQFAIAKPQDAAGVLLKNAPELNPDLVKASQTWLSQKYQDDASQWGIQKEQVWSAYANWMFERKLIPKNIDAKEAFTNQFLPAKQ